MLLMSGAFARWNLNLRYVILDEIHCISEEEGGSQWERLIKLLPCPFLAMSATVNCLKKTSSRVCTQLLPSASSIQVQVFQSR
ncbi:DEAD/DEAH box helicase domain-containing protein [Toxoplasma gondii RUB]|nr:DEAD/DEAH box helicase domain-containing protein [Toxoplasma gondii RUB]